MGAGGVAASSQEELAGSPSGVVLISERAPAPGVVCFWGSSLSHKPGGQTQGAGRAYGGCRLTSVPWEGLPEPCPVLACCGLVFRAPRPGCPCASCPLQVPCRCSPLSALQGLAPGSARSHLGVLTTQMNTKPGSGATKRGAGHSASPGLSRLPPRPAPPADRALVPLSSTAAASPRGSEMLPLALQAAPWLPPTARPRGFCAPPPPRGAPSRGVPRLHLSAGPAASARLLALCAPRAASLPRTPPGPAP